MKNTPLSRPPHHSNKASVFEMGDQRDIFGIADRKQITKWQLYKICVRLSSVSYSNCVHWIACSECAMACNLNIIFRSPRKNFERFLGLFHFSFTFGCNFSYTIEMSSTHTYIFHSALSHSSFSKNSVHWLTRWKSSKRTASSCVCGWFRSCTAFYSIKLHIVSRGDSCMSPEKKKIHECNSMAYGRA